jgi:hypothetical protein
MLAYSLISTNASVNKKKVKYLEYIINSQKGICVDSEKVEAIRAWEPPSIVKGVRGFLGFANYYRKFIPRFQALLNL